MACKTIPFYEFRPGLFEIDEFDCVSSFMVVGSERALLLDVGTGIGDLKWVVENRITDKPYQVAVSHNHGDHIGGAGFFDEIFIHPADMDNTDEGPPPQRSSVKDTQHLSGSEKESITLMTRTSISAPGRTSLPGNRWKTAMSSTWAIAK